jgi:mannosyltransferase OCH1-like enzyme
MIPPLLHQTWKSTNLPPNFKYWSDSFLECNPGIERRLYSDADNRALLAQTFPALLALYDEFPKEIFRVDFIRCVYLYCYGGVYADLDFQCLAPFSGVLLESDHIVLGRMGTDDDFAHSIPNAMMAATPGQGFWLGYLANIEARWRSRGKDDAEPAPEAYTGPAILRWNALQYQADRPRFTDMVARFVARHALVPDPPPRFDGLRLLPAHVWYPLNWNDRIHASFREQMLAARQLYTTAQAREIFPHSMAVTYWSHTW